MAANLDRELLGDYVDGELDDNARVAVAVKLADSPDDTAIVEQYRLQDRAIQDAFGPVLDEPIPEKLLNVVRRTASPKPENDNQGAAKPWHLQPVWRLAAVAAVLFLIVGAGSGGWVMRGYQETQSLNKLLIQQFVRSASDAYVLYDRDTDRRPSTKTERMKEFVAWLYESFGNDFTPPQLQAEGFKFAGGRLLPSVGGPAAQMTYTNRENQRVTLYFVKGGESPNPIEAAANIIAQTFNGFETFFVQDDKRSIYVWDQAPLKYAMVAEMKREDLSVLTEDVLSRLISNLEEK